MRSSPLVLLLLIGIQAVLNMKGGRALSTGAANHSVGEQTAANHRAGQQRMAAGDVLSQHPLTRERQKGSQHRTHSKPPREVPPGQDRSSVSPPSHPSVVEVDPKLFSKRRYRSSPRVVFSEVMPSHRLPEGGGGEDAGGEGGRVRRRAGAQPMHRGEYSVCDSINTWLANLTRATDMAGNEVTVLPKIKINNVEMKQFFYETTCRSAPHSRAAAAAAAAAGGSRGARQGAKSGNAGCRGIDSRHWNSYCTNTHTYVRAMTIFKDQTAWRYIRINAACVCVLSRKSWSKRLGH